MMVLSLNLQKESGMAVQMTHLEFLKNHIKVAGPLKPDRNDLFGHCLSLAIKMDRASLTLKTTNFSISKDRFTICYILN